MSQRSRPAFERLAIVNRGEPAMRLINAVREWNAEGRSPLRTIAVYTAVDRRAMFVREADEAVLIGPADPEKEGAAFSPSPYFDYAELERVLRVCRAEAVWPGWGFVSEQAEFAELCDRLGITFIGPAADVMRRLGDKIELKRLAEQVGVPVAACSGGPVAGRHVEVQVVADADGTVWTLGIRDCSVQRRNHKVIEESASTALDAGKEELLRSSAAELIRAAGYVNAGTVAFRYQPKERLLSFLEVTPRLGVEHPVTEVTTGVDIVKLQLHVAAGGKLADVAPGTPPESGHAIEARLTAEDPERGFGPAPGLIQHGLIQHLVLPTGPGIRVDTGVAAGDVIPPQYDSMIAKVIGWGRDRCEARARLSRALRQTAAVIDGGTTNKALLLDLLDRPEFVAGEVDTTWLDTMMAQGYAPPRRLDVALLAVAVEAHDAHVQRQQGRLFTAAERGRPEVEHESWYQVDVRAAGEAYRLRVARSRPTRYRVELDGRAVDVDVERAGRFERRLTIGDQTFAVLSVAQGSVTQGSGYLVEVGGAVHRISGGEAGLVRAPAPAMVVAVPVKAGDAVAEGDVVAVLESMKLVTALRAPVAGQVAEVLVDANTQIEGGTKLVRMEPDPELDGVGDPASGFRTDLSALVDTGPVDRAAAATADDALAALRSLVLGFSIDEREAHSLLRGLAAARADLPAEDPGLLAGEIEVLRIFADLCALSRNRRVPDGMEVDDESAVDAEATRNPQEYLYAYLRSRDADAEGLPESFRIKLRRALAHYGVTDLEPSPDLGPALYRIFLAHRRAGAHVPVVSELLQWRLRHPESLPDDARDGYRQVLDHLVSATQLRHPMIGDLARQVRYRCFDAPLIADERARVQQQVRAELDRLSPDPEARARQIDAMVASGEPILGVFAVRHHAAMIEVMTRRYYRIRPLEHVRVTDHDARPLLTAEYVHDGHGYAVVATTVVGGPDADSATAADLHQFIDALPADRTALIDLYVTSDADGGADPDARAGRIRDKLGTIPGMVGRVAVAVRRADGEDSGGPTWFTFRGAPGGGDGAAGTPVEDRTLRGLHPMVAERLGLWRLSGFELTRLPSATDVHLFRAQGREVPDDQRLIALADVRNLTTLRGDGGRIRGLPQLEHMLDACLDSLRAARSADRAAAKLEWNRVLLYVWPVVDVPLTELEEVVRSLAPRTEALGLEQVLVQFRMADAGASTGEPGELMLRMSRPPGAGLTMRITGPPIAPLRELDAYAQKVIRARRRGAVYPYELIGLITRSPDRGGAPARSPSTTSTSPGIRCRWTGRRVRTPRTWCSVWSPPRPSATRRA